MRLDSLACALGPCRSVKDCWLLTANCFMVTTDILCDNKMVGSFGQLNTFWWSTGAYGTNCSRLLQAWTSSGGQHTRLFCYCVSFYTVHIYIYIYIWTPHIIPSLRLVWAAPVSPCLALLFRRQPAVPKTCCTIQTSMCLSFSFYVLYLFLFCTWAKWGTQGVTPLLCAVLCTVTPPSLLCVEHSDLSLGWGCCIPLPSSLETGLCPESPE